MPQAKFPRSPLKILLYVFLDVIGTLLFTAGVLRVAQVSSLLDSLFPASTWEAVVVIIGGLALMLWAAMHILREAIRTKRSNDAVQGGK